MAFTASTAVNLFLFRFRAIAPILP
jgi:hypothetical protein